MGSSDSDGAAPSRKRSRASANSEDSSGKKARGRPRVDTQDETAADRRRTQIRLAQRAYRLRKETTISSLKERNDRLESIIDQMNKSFLKFNEAALKSGLLQFNPILAQQLKSVTESFVSLAKSAAEGQAEEEERDESIETNSVRNHEVQSAPPQRLDVGWGYSTTLNQSSTQHTSPSPPEESQAQSQRDLPLLPNFNAEQAKQGGLVQYRRPQIPDLFTQGASWAQASLDERPSEQPLPFGLLEILSQQEFKPPNPQNPNIFSVSIPTPRATPPMPRIPSPTYGSLTTRTPKPMWTYSHDETTFARRLTRASLETGFHLLGSASQRPAALEYIFRLSLPYMTLNELRERFKELLARGTDEELDFWSTPFIHLGGAGTHYPRKDAHGNIIKAPNTWNVRRIGPLDKKMIRAENCDDPSQSHDLNIDLTGFEGEWFDSNDVEGYLQQEKGVRIDPKSSFVDAFVDDDEHHGDDYFTFSAGTNNSSPRRLSNDSTPTFGSSSSRAQSQSSLHTPPNVQSATSANVNHLFAPSDIPFGLDMSMPSDFARLPSVDASAFFDQPLGLDLAPGFDVGLNNGSMQPLNFPDQPRGSNMDMSFQGLETMPVVRQKRKKNVLIDVTKLVDELVKHGVCLGRAPGFRRKDVDMAFQASLITTY
ncbi:BZIP family transcription factor [Paraphaeosphaeria sporulosa]